MKFNVTEVEFDFTDSQGELEEWEQDQIVKNNIGVWEADDEDDLIEEITSSTGWCITYSSSGVNCKSGSPSPTSDK